MLGVCECPAPSRLQLSHPEKGKAEPKPSGDLCKSSVLGVPCSHAPWQPPCPVLAAMVSDPKAQAQPLLLSPLLAGPGGRCSYLKRWGNLLES